MTTPKHLFTIKTEAPSELPAVVAKLLPHFAKQTILLLEGPVGAGKTELVKALTQALSLPETASPSFAIHHRYQSLTIRRYLDHVDLYRLENEDDLESTGFWDLFAEGAEQNLVVIEWAERLNVDLLPLSWKKIRVQIELLVSPQERRLTVSEF